MTPQLHDQSLPPFFFRSFLLLLLLLPLFGGGNYLFKQPSSIGILLIHLASFFLLLFWSLNRIRINSPIFPYAFIRTPIFYFVIINFISAYYSVNPFNGHQKILILLNGLAFYIFTQSMCKDKKDYINIIKALVLSGIPVIIYGLYQRFFEFREIGQTRIFSTFQNVNAFAGYLLIIIPLCLYLSVFSEKKVARHWSKIFLLLLLSGLILTFSKGGLLTFLIVSIGILFYLACHKKGTRLVLFLSFASIFAVLLFLVFIDALGDIKVLPEMNIPDSIRDRLEYWRMALGIISNYPITGSGLGGYAAMAQRYQIGSVYSRYAHNNYLQVIAELGVFGFITYIWFIFNTLTKGIHLVKKNKSCRNEGFFVLMAIIGFLIHSLIDFDWEIPAIQMTFFLLAGLINRIERIDGKPAKEEIEKADDRPGSGLWVQNIILILLIPLLLLGVISPFIADGYFRAAKEASNHGDLDLSIDLGRQAVKFVPYSGRHHNLLAVLTRQKGELNKDLSLYHLALKESEEAIRFEPATALYHNEKAKTLWGLDRRPDSITEFTRARELYPADISFRNDLGKAMILLSRYDSAIEELEVGILKGKDYLDRLHPDIRYLYDTYLLLGNAYSGKGELDKSLNAYGEIIKILSATPALYDENGNLINKNIIGAEAHFRIGEIYLAKGEKDLAIQEFRMAYDMNSALDHLQDRIKELKGT